MFQGVKVHKKSAELQYITQIFEDGMYLTPWTVRQSLPPPPHPYTHTFLFSSCGPIYMYPKQDTC